MSTAPLDDRCSRARFRTALLAWYRRNARGLPWRRTRAPYPLWVSEVLLQQTRVETVKPYYQRFLRAFPTVRVLAAASLDRVLKLWEGLGYYARARNLHAAARMLVAGFGQPGWYGRLARNPAWPQAAQQWLRLPGIGRYTAAAITSIAFGEPVPAVDGNVKRVLARLFALRTRLDEPDVQRRLWSLAEKLLSRSCPGEFNQAMMELGARICRPRQPNCPSCPVRRWCAARMAGIQNDLPRRRAKRPVPRVEAVAAAVRRNGRVLLVQRPQNGLLGGLWEFPGRTIQGGETPAEALQAHLVDALGLNVSVERALGVLRHTFSHFHLQVHAYACTPDGSVASARSDHGRWVPRGQVSHYALTRVAHRILARL